MWGGRGLFPFCSRTPSCHLTFVTNGLLGLGLVTRGPICQPRGVPDQCRAPTCTAWSLLLGWNNRNTGNGQRLQVGVHVG